jgi:DNA-directed RNA polymerase subunit RPC12/RpoP
MPDIHFDCPKCGQTIDAPQEMAAELIDCPSCKEVIEVPVRRGRVQPVAPVFVPPAPAPSRPKLTKCPSCDSDVSTEAAACPKCGHQFVFAGGFKYAGGINLKDPVHRIGLFICVIFLVGVIYYIYSVTFDNSAAKAQESEKLKELDKSTSDARKAVEDFDAALHPKQ